MHESPRTPCWYQLCVCIYACTAPTAFTFAPCWHQIRMHRTNSLHSCSFASAINNCKPNSSAKISKKRSKTFHLAVMGVQHTSRWLKLRRTQTTGAKAPSDATCTSSGWPHSNNRSGDAQLVLLQVQAKARKALSDGWPVGNNGIKPRLDDCQPHQLLTRDGKVTQRHVVRQERQRKVAQPKPGKLIFILCFTMRTGGP